MEVYDVILRRIGFCCGADEADDEEDVAVSVVEAWKGVQAGGLDDAFAVEPGVFAVIEANVTCVAGWGNDLDLVGETFNFLEEPSLNGRVCSGRTVEPSGDDR